MIRHHARPPFGHRRAPLALLLVLVALTTWSLPSSAQEPLEPPNSLPPELPDNPPGVPASLLNATSTAAVVSFGRFTSIQVNVDGSGANIIGDAANEPSIAVDPNNPSRIAIGWRQFDTITSNFRQAGFGYSADGGQSWTTGKIEPGVFRSDPVLGFDAQGKFFYNSLSNTPTFNCKVFPSTDGGMTWGAGVSAFGGDKQWMTNDRTAGTGHDNVYESWSSSSNPTPGNIFSRSIDDGASFQSPTSIPHQPIWGTLDVGPDGTLYMVGQVSNGTIYVGRSTDAKNPLVTPSFTTKAVNLGGNIVTGGPNPAGLLGQLWVAVDRSSGPRSGWVYALASVQTATDPLDVMFAHSTDGGQTWSAPVRVNDDPTGNRAFQWFGTMSVSPDGRIDVVWNDTRGSADSTQSALYYSFSNDGGVTWSPNEQASPVWNSTVGWPNQQKIGDYYHMISRVDGADLAWAATFNGEEDVYFLRIMGGTTAVADQRRPRLRLSGAPNPLSSSTTIRFEAPTPGGRARLDVFDASGRRVTTLVDAFVPGGSHAARWTGTDALGRRVKPGLYFVRLETIAGSQSLKLMVLR
ncbi:MAG: hypothetical protein E6K78_03015 [Candidatus Eisenbacteria bacterium]|uniref:T9SS type A sorting domain-containing protein n=1 Tax=Eiseniibacteriota bacterium TaxID=2212470 RepID=A0A538TWG2_UNCEI|nr:MAG: hypothetical protein E6K78_03015 [Candidatus Eisenbacteria bacterium]